MPSVWYRGSKVFDFIGSVYQENVSDIKIAQKRKKKKISVFLWGKKTPLRQGDYSCNYVKADQGSILTKNKNKK